MKPIAFDDVVIFVDAAANLADSLQNDIKKGDKISTNTVVLLSKFHIAAHNLKGLFDKIEEDKIKLN